MAACSAAIAFRPSRYSVGLEPLDHDRPIDEILTRLLL